MRAWIYLFIASIFEVAWIYSLKFMQFRKLIKMSFLEIFTHKEGLLMLAPLVGYVLFGLGNIYFFSRAMKAIPAAIAYASWMSIALVCVKVVDVTIFKEAISYQQVIFLLLILIGVVGLKIFA
ncbi:MAG TPA: SMR family transporter [Bacteroidia bacterium]|nr:SMR family transporter [Bacteroidia bacterium]